MPTVDREKILQFNKRNSEVSSYKLDLVRPALAVDQWVEKIAKEIGITLAKCPDMSQIEGPVTQKWHLSTARVNPNGTCEFIFMSDFMQNRWICSFGESETHTTYGSGGIGVELRPL